MKCTGCQEVIVTDDAQDCQDCGDTICEGCIHTDDEEVIRCERCHVIARTDDREPEDNVGSDSYAAEVVHWEGMA